MFGEMEHNSSFSLMRHTAWGPSLTPQGNVPRALWQLSSTPPLIINMSWEPWPCFFLTSSWLHITVTQGDAPHYDPGVACPATSCLPLATPLNLTDDASLHPGQASISPSVCPRRERASQGCPACSEKLSWWCSWGHTNFTHLGFDVSLHARCCRLIWGQATQTLRQMIGSGLLYEPCSTVQCSSTSSCPLSLADAVCKHGAV